MGREAKGGGCSAHGAGGSKVAVSSFSLALGHDPQHKVRQGRVWL